jgi:hypothetical protein
MNDWLIIEFCRFEIMSECWATEPEERPKMRSLLAQMETLKAELDLYV